MEQQKRRIDSPSNITQANGKVLRYVNPECRFQYEMLKETGLNNRLVTEELMIEQHIIDFVKSDANSYCVIEWERIPIITYSYEWSFIQLKEAALTTLQIHRYALDYGMILKDASAQNIQFFGIKAKLIDALCLEIYEEGTGWAAYDQFCRHFLAPLLLMKKLDIRLQQFAEDLPRRNPARSGFEDVDTQQRLRYTQTYTLACKDYCRTGESGRKSFKKKNGKDSQG